MGWLATVAPGGKISISLGGGLKQIWLDSEGMNFNKSLVGLRQILTDSAWLNLFSCCRLKASLLAGIFQAIG